MLLKYHNKEQQVYNADIERVTEVTLPTWE